MEFNELNRKAVLLSIASLCFTLLLYQTGLLSIWVSDEEYGHGLMVLGVLGYVLYQNRTNLVLHNIGYNWVGIFISLLALIAFIMGVVSGIVPIQMYSIWLFAIAAIVSFGGINLLVKLLIPLAIIFLLIPLPNVLGPMLTSSLQLVSSKLGVWLIRLFGGVVFLEGNVIDMGNVKLLVAEACAGLRYLFPLMSIGAIAAYLINAPSWMKLLLFFSTIPITIFMNSLRIAVTGILTEAYDTSHTEGFLHFFEGWVIFIASLVLLITFAFILVRLLPGKVDFIDVFSISQEKHIRSYSVLENKSDWQVLSSSSFMLVTLVLAVIVSVTSVSSEKLEISRKSFSEFPYRLGSWQSVKADLPVSLDDAIDADDYYHGNFKSADGSYVNLYISYYMDQKKGVAPHSPELCIPGDGWVIINDSPVVVTRKDNIDISVSRLLMTKGDKITVAYYWVKQGSNVFQQQYMARLDLIRFAIVENRADAALIRIITQVKDNEDVNDADKRIQNIASEIFDVINEYVPD